MTFGGEALRGDMMPWRLLRFKGETDCCRSGGVTAVGSVGDISRNGMILFARAIGNDSATYS